MAEKLFYSVTLLFLSRSDSIILHRYHEQSRRGEDFTQRRGSPVNDVKESKKHVNGVKESKKHVAFAQSEIARVI
jgi:RNase adaptor protein for sRNA GlmZ degradation